MEEIRSDNLDTLWDFGDPAASAQRFESLLGDVEAMQQPMLRAEAQTQWARALGLQDRFAEAHRVLDEIDPGIVGASPRVRVRFILERGRVFNSSGEKAEAVPLFLQAWECAQAPELDYHAVDAAHMLAIALPPEEQPHWMEKGVHRAESSNDPKARGWLGALHNNLGWTRHDAGDFAGALASFEAALAAYLERGKPRQVRIAKWTVARALRSLGRVQEALERQMSLLAELDSLNEKDGFVHEEIGECLLACDQPMVAANYFAQAYTLLSADAWLAANEAARIERLRALGSA